MTEDFTDFAYCYNCKFYDPKKNFCETHSKVLDPQKTCSFFEGRPSQLSYDDFQKQQKALQKPDQDPPRKIINLKQRLSEGIPETKWRVENLLPIPGVTIIGGASGSYKTWAAIQMALSIATGKDFLGQYSTDKCPVLYIDEENGDPHLIPRIDKLMRGMDLKPDDVDQMSLCFHENVKLDSWKSDRILKDLIFRTGSKVVIIDSVVRCMEGEEDKSADVRKIFETFKSVLKDHPDVSFILLHHTSKALRNGLNGLRGSGDFGAMADSVLMFEGRKSYALAEVVKNRHADREKMPPFIIKLVDEPDGFKLLWLAQADATTRIEECAQALLNWIECEEREVFQAGEAEKESKKGGFSKATFYSALAKLKDDRKIRKTNKRGQYQFIDVVVEENLEKYDG